MMMENSIKSMRKSMGLRQEDMANQLGVTRQTIIAIENNKYNPTLELAMKIAKLLQNSVEDIFILEDQVPLQMRSAKAKKTIELTMVEEKN